MILCCLFICMSKSKYVHVYVKFKRICKCRINILYPYDLWFEDHKYVKMKW